MRRLSDIVYDAARSADDAAGRYMTMRHTSENSGRPCDIPGKSSYAMPR